MAITHSGMVVTGVMLAQTIPTVAMGPLAGVTLDRFDRKQPFYPAYLTASRNAKAKKLKFAITAGIGSDHVELKAAAVHSLAVVEESFSNGISVAEHVVMMALSLLREYLPTHQSAGGGGWNIADCVSRSYHIEGMYFGTLGAGRIGLAILRRLKAFDVVLHCYALHRQRAEVEKELGLTYHDTPESLLKVCDVVDLMMPVYPETTGLFNDAMFAQMKHGPYLILYARGSLCDRDAVFRAIDSGKIAGCAGDVWYPQPAQFDHPWRTMRHNGMSPRTSGTSSSRQARYAAGTRENVECSFSKRPIGKRVSDCRRRGSRWRWRSRLQALAPVDTSSRSLRALEIRLAVLGAKNLIERTEQPAR